MFGSFLAIPVHRENRTGGAHAAGAVGPRERPGSYPHLPNTMMVLMVEPCVGHGGRYRPTGNSAESEDPVHRHRSTGNPTARQADMDPSTVETFSNPSRRSRLDAMEDL